MKKKFIILATFVFLIFSGGNVARAQPNPHATCDELLKDIGLREALIQNLNQVANYPGQYAGASQMIMIKLIEHFKYASLDFHFFERFFRQENAPLYLIASSEALDPGFGISYFSPMAEFKAETPVKYYLWIGVRGKAEADNYKRFLGITDEENLERLKETGNIVVESREVLQANEGKKVKVLDEDTVKAIGEIRAVTTDGQGN